MVGALVVGLGKNWVRHWDLTEAEDGQQRSGSWPGWCIRKPAPTPRVPFTGYVGAQPTKRTLAISSRAFYKYHALLLQGLQKPKRPLGLTVLMCRQKLWNLLRVLSNRPRGSLSTCSDSGASWIPWPALRACSAQPICSSFRKAVIAQRYNHSLEAVNLLLTQIPPTGRSRKPSGTKWHWSGPWWNLEKMI